MGVLDRSKAFALAQLNGVDTLSSVTADAEVVNNGTGIKVTLLGVRGSFFGDLLPPGGFKTKASSTAVTMNGFPLCVLAQQSSGSKVLNLIDSAKIQGNGCLVHSNRDIAVESTSTLVAGSVQASGSTSGTITPKAAVGAPTTPDPFRRCRPRPTPSAPTSAA